MVSLELSEEERMIQQVAHDFAKKEIRPTASYYDEHEEVPYDLIKKGAGIGFGISKSGGLLATTSALVPSIIAEELSWGCAGIALAINSSGLAAAAIAATGSPEQRDRWLAEIASDENEVHLGAMCLTEPDAGSDVSNIQTTATRDGDDYVLNGEKQFITNGGIADVHVVFATEDRSKGWGGLSCFVVPKGTPGLQSGTVWKKMGIRASHTANVVLNDCRVPASYKLGGSPAEGSGGGSGGPGALGALMTLERTRPVVGAYALGIGRAAYEYALDYAKERVQFGRPIVKNQGISFMLADMAMAVDSARLMVWRAAWMGGANVPYLSAEGSMAKCFASDMAMKVTVDAVQVLGGQGYMRDHPVEKWVRDAKIFQIFEGTNQIQRMVIGRALESQPKKG
ncbi:MAG: acyl-CoA dehydrogenase family protein [Dehalococcoidia bacterium]|nr:acyl-CoA dehydrogenase family protein [Dehalococcoidia bacterium]